MNLIIPDEKTFNREISQIAPTSKTPQRCINTPSAIYCQALSANPPNATSSVLITTSYASRMAMILYMKMVHTISG